MNPNSGLDFVNLTFIYVNKSKEICKINNDLYFFQDDNTLTKSELVPNKYFANENVAPKALFHFSPPPLMFFEMSFPKKYIPITTTRKIPKNTATRVLMEPSVAPIIFDTDSDKYTAA